MRLIFLLLFTSTVNANELYSIGNEAGGKIVLTDVKCNDINQFIIYATNPKTNNFFGCYMIRKNSIYVEWQNGKLDKYNLNNWQKLNYF